MKMKITGIFIVLSLLLGSMLIGCQPQFQSGTYTDDMGREVRIDKVPQRIVSLAPSHTEILFALGLEERVVGVSDFCDYPEEARAKPKVGGFYNPSIEKIVDLAQRGIGRADQRARPSGVVGGRPSLPSPTGFWNEADRSTSGRHDPVGRYHRFPRGQRAC